MLSKLIGGLARLIVFSAKYVACDSCGDPAEVDTDNTAAGARRLAAQEGFVRVTGGPFGPRQRRDLCKRCAKKEGVSRGRYARGGPG